jgi:uncharacterized membrane protein
MEMILSLIGLLIMAVVLAVVVALPILALTQFFQIKQRLQTLEREVRQLRKKASAAAGPTLATEEQGAEAEVVPIVELAPQPAEPAEPRHERKRRHEPDPVRTEPDWARLEAWLGMRGLGWAAVVLLLFTGGFFLKLAFERGWIGELGRIMIGVGLGTLLCVGGWGCHRRGQTLFSQMLTSAGIALLYLTTFATFGFYRLINQQQAAPFLMILVAQAFTLAALYRAPAIAIMAVVGGLLNPILLDTGADRYRELFVYLGILSAGVVTAGLFRRWWGVTTLALVGTHALFWFWYDKSYHPAKLDACLLFQGALFTLYLGQAMVVHVWQKQRANVEDLLRLLLLTVLTSTAGYQLLDPQFPLWMGTFAVGLAIVFALLASLVNRFRAADEPLLLVLIALAMALLAAVFPLQCDAAWIAVGWAVQGLTLWWFGLRVRARLLYGFGAAFLVLALGRLLLVDTVAQPPHVDPFIPIFNRYGLPAAIVAGSLIAAALLQRRTRPVPFSVDFLVMRCLGLAGVVTLWIVLSIETYDFFVVRADLGSPGAQALLTPREREMPQQELQQIFYERGEHLRLTAQMALSALWAVFALVQLAVGLRLQHPPLRWLALGLFALTLGKVMLIDTSRLDGMYRVGAFFALSLMMAAGAWAYQKLRHVLAETETDHEPNV